MEGTVRARAAGTAAALLLSLLVAACSRPLGGEYFVRSGDRDALGRYPFSAQLADSISYWMDLYFLFDCNDLTFRKFEGFEIELLWQSPSGESLREAGWVGQGMISRKTFFTKTLFVPYREDSRPSESGEWKLSVGVPAQVVRDFGLYGIGLDIHGTR